MKSLKDISWQVDEPTYREDPAYSYSTISKFQKEGFEHLDTLFDRVDTPSLLFGSMVDTLVTDSEEEYNNKYFAAVFPEVNNDFKPLVQTIKEEKGDVITSLYQLSNETIVEYLDRFGIYQNNWKIQTKADKVREACEAYYKLLFLSEGKTLVTSEMNDDAHACFKALKESEATKWYFQSDNPFDGIERLYQLKWKGEYEGISLRCMMDLAIIDHKNKIIIPCDLKTSSHLEYDFYKSYVQWNYQIQNNLYSYLLKQNIEKDEYFKDFKILPYRFIVVNRKELNPKVWEVNGPMQWSEVDFTIGEIEFRNWRNIVKELHYYMTHSQKSPIGIKENEPNSLVEWIKTLKK